MTNGSAGCVILYAVRDLPSSSSSSVYFLIKFFLFFLMTIFIISYFIFKYPFLNTGFKNIPWRNWITQIKKESCISEALDRTERALLNYLLIPCVTTCLGATLLNTQNLPLKGMNLYFQSCLMHNIYKIWGWPINKRSLT